MKISYGFGFTDALLSENAGVSLKDLHCDIDAILRAFDAVKPLAEELGVPAPTPRLAGFAYPHMAALGAETEFPEDGEPKVMPLISSPAEIDRLRPPDDYLAAPLIQTRIRLAEELQRRRSNASKHIGHNYEGPLTTAMLIMGQDFLMLPYDDPTRAHKLLEFCTDTAIQYAHAIHKRVQGVELEPGSRGIPDDFAGMLPPELFGEFVVPYWNRLYEGMHATRRGLHSELLREGHLPYLRDAKIDSFDPSADQYVTPELLQRACPCKFATQIMSWHINDMTADQLEQRCREVAACGPERIFFYLNSLSQLPKIKRLLAVTRQIAET